MAVLLRLLRSIGQRAVMQPCLTPLRPELTTLAVWIRTRWRLVMICLISISSWWSTRLPFLCFKIIISSLAIPSCYQSLLSMRATSMPTTETIGRRQPKKVRASPLKTASDMLKVKRTTAVSRKAWMARKITISSLHVPLSIDIRKTICRWVGFSLTMVTELAMVRQQPSMEILPTSRALATMLVRTV